jgi:hypothetical protein
MFEPGQRVVCIDDSGFPTYLLGSVYEAFPVKGKTYVVRDIVPASESMKVFFDKAGKVDANTCAVLLQGIRNKANKHGVESGYKPQRFRELEEDTREEHQEEEQFAEVPAKIGG